MAAGKYKSITSDRPVILSLSKDLSRISMRIANATLKLAVQDSFLGKLGITQLYTLDLTAFVLRQKELRLQYYNSFTPLSQL